MLHSVAHRVSHQVPAESEMSRQNRATPPQIKVSHLSPDPPVALSSHFAAGRGRGGLVEGIAALLGSENGSRYRGVSQLQSHQSRYSVQLRFTRITRRVATKAKSFRRSVTELNRTKATLKEALRCKEEHAACSTSLSFGCSASA